MTATATAATPRRTVRQPAVRDAAWGRWYARHGAGITVIRTRRGIPQPADDDTRLAAYRARLAGTGYDHRELARRAANGAQLQDRIRARSVIDDLLSRINPDHAPVQVRSTRENSGQPQLALTERQVMRG